MVPQTQASATWPLALPLEESVSRLLQGDPWPRVPCSPGPFVSLPLNQGL